MLRSWLNRFKRARLDEDAEIVDAEISATTIRFIKLLDDIDSKVEFLRKEALDLQGKADILNMSIDLLKNHEHLGTLAECEREEIDCYVQRIGGRLSTIELNVRTVRDKAQEDSLHQVNMLIDQLIITNSDPTLTRQKCQMYLNACSAGDLNFAEEATADVVDKKFENALLGCTLDDQKNIKKRLLALLRYLSKQSVSD